MSPKLNTVVLLGFVLFLPACSRSALPLPQLSFLHGDIEGNFYPITTISGNITSLDIVDLDFQAGKIS